MVRIVSLLVALIAASVSTTAVDRVWLTSPTSKLVFEMFVSDGRLSYSVWRGGKQVIEPSPLGILVDNEDLGQYVEIGATETYDVNHRYEWRGVHAEAVNRARGEKITIDHRPSGTRYGIEVRAFDDAVAFRFVVPGTGRRVPDAASGFRLPAGSIVWSHSLGGHYEGVYERRRVEDIAAGDWAAPPITAKLPNGEGYVAITEADLRNYAGMVLQADGDRGFRARLAHAAPAGYPFTLRFGAEEAARLANASPIEGVITTPWRVISVGADLNALVNSDVVHNLCPPPDKQLFPDGMQTSWIKPGRAVWRFLDGGDNTFEGIKAFSRLAGELGFEHHVVEGIWQKWTDAELRELVEYSRARGVSIWVWRHRRTIGDASERRALFESLHKAGVVGVKVDFLDHEAKEVIDLYQAILKDAAEFHLMVNFHGANKPTGEPRTWPNEMTREGIYGLENRRMEAWATFNTTFPFVRMLAGHADYTPTVFGERRRETSWAHQIASAAILTSPLLVYGGHPASLLANPAAEMIKSIPSTWDETIVLPPSEIGEAAVFARRSGDRWFVAAMNGPEERKIKVDLSFLKHGTYQALIVRDKIDDGGAVVVERRQATAKTSLEVHVRGGGGFVVRFNPQ